MFLLSLANPNTKVYYTNVDSPFSLKIYTIYYKLLFLLYVEQKLPPHLQIMIFCNFPLLKKNKKSMSPPTVETMAKGKKKQSEHHMLLVCIIIRIV